MKWDMSKVTNLHAMRQQLVKELESDLADIQHYADNAREYLQRVATLDGCPESDRAFLATYCVLTHKSASKLLDYAEPMRRFGLLHSKEVSARVDAEVTEDILALVVATEEEEAAAKAEDRKPRRVSYSREYGVQYE
jgi:hypothetical protein